MSDRMHDLYDQRDRSGNSPIDQALDRRKLRAEAVSSGTDRETLAKLFHENYERLAPSFGYATRQASAVAWDAVPEPNKSLMIAVADAVIAAGYRKEAGQ
jgi:dephospho-CoA kinase